MKIGLLTSWDFNDPNAWSGVIFHAREVLTDCAEVILIQVPEIRDSPVDRILAKFLGKLGYSYLTSDAFFSTVKKSRVVKKLVSKQQLDIVISLAASKESLGVPRHIPIIQVTDSSFKAMIDSYFKDRKVSFLSRIQGQVIDFLVSRKSDHYCVASEWSACQLMNDVKVQSHDISVIPFGPGIVPGEAKVASSVSADLSLLFVASNWKRKGG